jgi:ligand-binding SRPBCC domain-containing protein
MKIYTLKRRQTIKRPREEVFRFFESPENLERITPKSVGFNILTPRPIKMKVGTVLDYTIRLMGLQVRWTTLISEYEPPHRFCDVSIRGPYSYWHHTHTFEDTEDGTVMTDEVRYAMPFGFLGRVVRLFWVRRQLDQIFDYRARVIGKMLEEASPRSADGSARKSASEPTSK